MYINIREIKRGEGISRMKYMSNSSDQRINEFLAKLSLFIYSYVLLM